MKLPKIKLPKWPCMTITGKDVFEEQAKEIIFTTDSFLHSLGSLNGGNNRIWKNKFRIACGLEQFNDADYLCDNDTRIDKLEEYLKIVDAWYEDFGFPLQYLKNDWASSAYIDGPSGWCTAAGKIGTTINIGKWPTVTEVAHELKELAKKFKFLDMTITLYDVGDEDAITPSQLISFVIKDGKVSLNENLVDFVSTRKELSEEEFGLRIQDRTCSYEQGLPEEMVAEFACEVKEWMSK